MVIVILGGEPNVTTLIHFLGPTSQVFTYSSIHDSNDLNLGERYKGKGVPFCKHLHHPGHLCNQPVGRDLHPEEGENWNPLSSTFSRASTQPFSNLLGAFSALPYLASSSTPSSFTFSPPGTDWFQLPSLRSATSWCVTPSLYRITEAGKGWVENGL